MILGNCGTGNSMEGGIKNGVFGKYLALFRKWYTMRTYLQWKTNMNSYAIYQWFRFLIMTSSDPWPR